MENESRSSHADARFAITNTVEEHLLSGEAYRSIAKRFSISAPALFRHKTEHLLESVQRSHDASEVLRADALVDHLKRLRARTEDLYAEAESILSQARRAKDLRTALDGVRTAAAVIRETRSNRGAPGASNGHAERNGRGADLDCDARADVCCRTHCVSRCRRGYCHAAAMIGNPDHNVHKAAHVCSAEPSTKRALWSYAGRSLGNSGRVQ
jgi:transposase-like protein